MALILLAVAAIGAALVVTGVAMVSPPWGLIVGGAALVALAWKIAEERDVK